MSRSPSLERETMIVIVGAGAALKAGLPSSEDLLEVVRRALPMLVEPGLRFQLGQFSYPSIDRTTPLADILHTALLSAFPSYDFELILNALEELEILAHATEMPRMWPEFRPVVSAFTDFATRYARIADSTFLREARLSVITAIHSRVGDLSYHPFQNRDGSDPRVARAQLSRILQALSNKYRLVVIDLCYDDVIDQVGPSLEDGFADTIEWFDDPNATSGLSRSARAFSPDHWDGIGQSANLLIHLHGSILYGWAPGHAMARLGRIFLEPVKYGTATAALESLRSTRGSGNIVGGQNVEGTPIISGRQKGGKMIYNTRPYGYYYRSIMDLVPRSRHLLVMGYSWHDPHLNTWIDEMISRQPERRAAIVTHLPGREVFENTNQRRYVSMLAGLAWNRIESRTYARSPHEPNLDGFFSDDNFAILPSGFILQDDEERQLIDFLLEA